MSVRILVGDCRVRLAELAPESVHVCCTSPPYWNLRSYLPAEHPDKARELGSERTVEEYVANLVDVFRAVWRVLRKDGTLWLNLGDSFYGAGGANNNSGLSGRNIAVGATQDERDGPRVYGQRQQQHATLKPKDLVGIPWRVALALQADGWWLRSDLIWQKPNPMPESVLDRPTRAHEYVFLLAKAERYFYDGDAIREPYNEATIGRYETPMMGVAPTAHKPGGDIGRREREKGIIEPNALGRNRRSVWTVSTQSFKGSHFATFPPALVEPMILAGSPERCCPTCGTGWRRVVERQSNWQERKAAGATAGNLGSSPTYQNGVHGGRVDHDLAGKVVHMGFQPGCPCPANDGSGRAVALDLFGGAGTVGLVADRLGRDAVLVELNPEYAELARQRLTAEAPLLADVAVEG